MDKKYVNNLIDDSIVVEELAIPIYKKHLDNELFWSGFSPEDEQFIRDSLEVLVSESTRHIQILNKIKAKMEE